MANYPQELAQDAVCQSHTGHITGLWFLPTRPLRLSTNEWMNLINDMIFGGEGKEVTELQMCFDFPYTFVWNNSYSKKNSARSYKRGNQDCVDRLVTTVGTGLPRLWIPARARYFFFFQNHVYRLRGPPSPIFHAYRGYAPGWRWRIWCFGVGPSSASISEVKNE